MDFQNDTTKISIFRSISDTHKLCKAIIPNLLKSGTNLGNNDNIKKYLKRHILAKWGTLYLIFMYF